MIRSEILYMLFGVCREWDVNEKAKWAEKLEEKVGYHRMLNDMKETGAEVRQAAKATIMVSESEQLSGA